MSSVRNAVDELAEQVYVINSLASTLSIVDEAALTVVRTHRIPPHGSSATLNREAGLLYRALKGEDRVAVVRLGDLE